MEVVADTSVFLAVALDEPEKAAIVQCTKGVRLVAPEVLPYEIGNALSAMHKRRRLAAEVIPAVHEVVSRIPVRLVPVDIAAALEMALEFGLYAYDAYFIECAVRRRRPLLSLDGRMLDVAARVGVDPVVMSV